MGLTVSNNVSNIIGSLNKAQKSADTSMTRLSSGQRINSAKDDAAGLAIATRMSSRLAGMAVAQRNAADGLSIAEVADSAISQVSSIMSRLNELSTLAANASLDAGDRTNLDAEFQELTSEITRTLSSADFNGKKILAGGAGANVFQVGPEATDTVMITTTNLSTNTDITAVTGGDLATAANATTALGNIKTAMTTLTTEAATYGAVMSRFDSIQQGLVSQSSAMQGALDRIMSTDYGTEMASLQKNNVLQQAATAMLAQANQRPSQILSLLR